MHDNGASISLSRFLIFIAHYCISLPDKEFFCSSLVPHLAVHKSPSLPFEVKHPIRTGTS